MIPKEILELASIILPDHEPRFDYLGKRDEWDYWVFLFPDNEITGYPRVFHYKKGTSGFSVSGE